MIRTAGSWPHTLPQARWALPAWLCAFLTHLRPVHDWSFKRFPGTYSSPTLPLRPVRFSGHQIRQHSWPGLPPRSALLPWTPVLELSPPEGSLPRTCFRTQPSGQLKRGLPCRGSGGWLSSVKGQSQGSRPHGLVPVPTTQPCVAVTARVCPCATKLKGASLAHRVPGRPVTPL